MFSKLSLRSLARLTSKPTASWQKYQSNCLAQMKYALAFQSANTFATKPNKPNKPNNAQKQNPQKKNKKKEPNLEDIKKIVDSFYKPYEVISESDKIPFDWNNLSARIEELHREPITNENDLQYRRALKQIELSYLKDIKNPATVPSLAIIELGYLFGSNDFGSQVFWNSVVGEFSTRINEYDFEYVARFVYGATHKVVIGSTFWETVTEYFRENPHNVPLQILCYLMPTIIRTFRQGANESKGQQGEKDSSKQVESVEDELSFVERIRENELWNILKNSAIEQIEDFNADQLAQIAWCFSVLQYEDQGLWTTIYEMYRGFRHEYDSNQLSVFTEIFATMECGDREFWEDMETHTLANLKDMDTNLIIDFMRGFSKREEGSFKLWNEFTEQIINRRLDPDQLSSVIQSFGDYELVTQSNWEVLEKKLLELLPFMAPGHLVRVIMGFGKSDKGSQNLWDKIEEQLLSEKGLQNESHLAVYTVLKSYGRLTPALASHYESLADEGDEILEQMREYNEAQQQDKYL